MENKEDPFPDVFRLEVSGNCNFSCKHCPTGRRANNRGILKPQAFDQIISQFAEYGFVPRVAVLYHGGEPLLNKYLEQYIATFKSLGVKKTVITTNASLLTPERAEKLVIAGLDEIKISFDGESPAENDQIRAGGNFKRDAGNVMNLIRIRDRLGSVTPTVRISNVRIAHESELNGLLEKQAEFFEVSPRYLRVFFAKENVPIQSLPAMVWPGMEDVDCKSSSATAQVRTYCTSLFETFSVLANGNVVACCHDLVEACVFGNVFKNSMFEIWRNNKFVDFRRKFRNGEYSEPCKTCVFVQPKFFVA